MGIVTRAELVEACSEAAHDAWMAEKIRRGVRSWPNEDGIEQLVAYAELSEPIKDFDRIVVGNIMDVLLKKVGLYEID
jgi:hypothetical protein